VAHDCMRRLLENTKGIFSYTELFAGIVMLGYKKSHDNNHPSCSWAQESGIDTTQLGKIESWMLDALNYVVAPINPARYGKSLKNSKP
jgi:hypothetical protein